MKNYWNQWNAMRIIRLLLGILIIAQGVVMKEWIFAILGFIFALMPILNIGCGSACNTQYRGASNNKNSSNSDIQFDEIK